VFGTGNTLGGMPVMIVGADTDLGDAIITGMAGRNGEIRAFVTDLGAAERLKSHGVKVATGDVSDPSHIEAACTNVHTAVLLTEAAHDGRVRSFASSPDAVVRGWADAVGAARVKRVVWVDHGDPPTTSITEEAVVDATLDVETVVSTVVELDEAQSIPSRR
jgi:uncharacterized protein YbjT (DUF2867 family)